jgi:hypothetical protein
MKWLGTIVIACGLLWGGIILLIYALVTAHGVPK